MSPRKAYKYHQILRAKLKHMKAYRRKLLLDALKYPNHYITEANLKRSNEEITKIKAEISRIETPALIDYWNKTFGTLEDVELD